jgi:hypothetical protein
MIQRMSKKSKNTLIKSRAKETSNLSNNNRNSTNNRFRKKIMMRKSMKERKKELMMIKVIQLISKN